MFERSITSLTGRSSAASVRSRRLGASVRDAVLGVDPSNEMLRRGVAKAVHVELRGVENGLWNGRCWTTSCLVDGVRVLCLFLFISEWMELSKKMWRLPRV